MFFVAFGFTIKSVYKSLAGWLGGAGAGRERVSADSVPLTTNIMEVTCFESRWKFRLVK